MAVSCPAHAHRLTVVALHGFNSSGPEFQAKLRSLLPRHVRNHTRLVFPSAPTRRITCYRNSRMSAWHDYFTNYGDFDDAQEEDIDVEQLKESSSRIQMLVAAERERCSRTVLLGESQGGCVAIDVALRFNVPAISLFGQRYRSSPSDAFHPPIFSLHGGWDTVIPPEIGVSSLETIPNVRLKTVRGYTHAQGGRVVNTFIRDALVTLSL